jgi:hypothetical protein
MTSATGTSWLPLLVIVLAQLQMAMNIIGATTPGWDSTA